MSLVEHNVSSFLCSNVFCTALQVGDCAATHARTSRFLRSAASHECAGSSISTRTSFSSQAMYLALTWCLMRHTASRRWPDTSASYCAVVNSRGADLFAGVSSCNGKRQTNRPGTPGAVTASQARAMSSPSVSLVVLSGMCDSVTPCQRNPDTRRCNGHLSCNRRRDTCASHALRQNMIIFETQSAAISVSGRHVTNRSTR
jgi:hypothetical protein